MSELAGMPARDRARHAPAVGAGAGLRTCCCTPRAWSSSTAAPAAILTRCDGARTLADIVADLERTYGASGLMADVQSFVSFALEKRWLELRA